MCGAVDHKSCGCKAKRENRPPCRQCGAGSRLPRSRFCSIECKATAKTMHNKHVGVCVVCGKSFVGGVTAATCSRVCQGERRRRLAVPLAACGFCGCEFRPHNNLYRSYCSRSCARNHRAALQNGMKLLKLALRQFQNGMKAIVRRGNQRRQLMARQSGTCELCSVTFARKSTSQTQCESCRDARKRAEKRAYKRRRKQLIREKSGLATRDVWERDPLCHLCGCETVIGDGHDPTDARYANADHLIPISRGGRHSIENVRIACRKCNLAKSNMTRDEFLSLPQHEQENRRVRFLGKVCHG